MFVYIRTDIYIYIYIYKRLYLCVCVCVCKMYYITLLSDCWYFSLTVVLSTACTVGVETVVTNRASAVSILALDTVADVSC